MATTNKISPVRTTKHQFLFSYCTGGFEAATCLRLISPIELYRELKTEHMKEHAWWVNRGSRTVKQYNRWLERRPRASKIFPYILPGVALKVGYIGDIDDDLSGDPRNLSGLVLLTFQRKLLPKTAVLEAQEREALWQELLALPLLGPSVVMMFGVLGQSWLQVLVATEAEATESYWIEAKTIGNYIKAVSRDLDRRLDYMQRTSRVLCFVGSDPLAYMQPAPAGGYPVFPYEQALPIINEERSRRPRPKRCLSLWDDCPVTKYNAWY